MLPIVYASVGNPLAFSEISKKVGISSETDVRSLLQGQIKEHHRLFGTEPYKIEYNREKDSYQIRPNGIVGRIFCGNFVLEISSKFEGIEIGKWLQLSHYSGANHLVRHNNDVAESAISQQDTFAGIDYFALALTSSVQDCLNDGLIYEKGTRDGDDPNFRGKLNVRKHIQKGANPLNLQTTQNIKRFDCNANSLIKRALEVCVEKTANIKIRGLADIMLSHFSEVSAARVETEPVTYDFVSSLPRPDYGKALAISKIVLEGFSAVHGDDSSFLPYYTINLDELFEQYVGYELQKLLRKDSYIVDLQKKLPHPLVPELNDNFIVPDIVVRGDSDAEARPVVIDAKNKYSMLSDSGAVRFSNQDLFQIVYYCQTVKTNIAIIVYPGDLGSSTTYPLQHSESKEQYLTKRERAVQSMFEDGNCAFKYKTESTEIYIIAWRINLAGSLHESRTAAAQLSQFIADCVKREIL
jgi:5-methylcytosine-specific restriction endonuclease McrBC regulatory subunit McrC